MPKKLQNPINTEIIAQLKGSTTFTALINPRVSIGLRRHRLGWRAASPGPPGTRGVLSGGDTEASVRSAFSRLATVPLYRCGRPGRRAQLLSACSILTSLVSKCSPCHFFMCFSRVL